MKKILLSVSLCLLAILANRSFAQVHKFDNWKQPEKFKGFTIKFWNNKDQRAVTQKDFTDCKSTGANIVIIQTAGFRESSPPYGRKIYWNDDVDTVYWEDVLNTMTGYARNAGLNYVIAVRTGPGRSDVWAEGAGEEPPSTIWTNKTEQQLYGQMLKDIATKYSGDPLCMGIDMIQEPNPGDDLWGGIHPDDYKDSLDHYGIDINDFYTLLIDSVRTADPYLPLMVQCIHWSDPFYFSLMTKQPDERIVYNMHTYNPQEYTHDEEMNTADYPGTYWNPRSGEDSYYDVEFIFDSLFSDVDKFQRQHDVPILVGEFGLMLPQKNGELYIEHIVASFCLRGWHFAFWEFRGDAHFDYEYFDVISGGYYFNTVKWALECFVMDVNDLNENICSCVLPNPFSKSTTISFRITSPANTVIKIFDIFGNVVSVPLNEFMDTGEKSVRIDCSSLTHGMYYYSLQTGDKFDSGKLMLIK